MPPECKPPPHYRRAPTTTTSPETLRPPPSTPARHPRRPPSATSSRQPRQPPFANPTRHRRRPPPATPSRTRSFFTASVPATTAHRVIPLKRQVKVINDKEVEKALDEGYICEKFCEMSVIDADYLRGYNRCNICNAKKLAQRSDDETYKGIHTCLRLSVTTDSINESESALSILKNSDYSTTVTDNPSGLNCTKK
ncbi:putative transcription factor WRKY family [Helianthus annuus]|nr:putative transcription factor WRKY family [Helianthus annuus]